MRKTILLLLALILPLQAAWAAASGYCKHEQGAAVQHVGHHAHTHSAADGDNAAGGSQGNFHGDCAYCHLGAASAVMSQFHLASCAAALPAVAPPEEPVASACLEGPERPKWSPAA